MKIVCDNKIPFLKGVLEPYAEVVYLPGRETTAEVVRDADAVITRTRTKCDAALLEGSAVKGDINLDGKVDVDDVNILINIILEHEPADGYGQRPYIDGDDKIDVADVNALLNIILQS